MTPIFTAHAAPPTHEGLLRSQAELREAAATVDTWFRSAADRGYKMCTLAAAPRSDAAAAGVTRLAPADLHPAAAPVRLVRAARGEGFAGLGVLIWADQVIADTSREFHDGIETALTELCAEHPVAVLCVYDRLGVGAHCLDMAVGHHVGGLHEQQLTVRATDDTLRLGGEIDLTNLDVLDAALRTAAAARPERLRIDLSATVFVSAGAAQLLHRHAAALHAAGTRLLLDGMAPHIERVLRLAARHSRPGG